MSLRVFRNKFLRYVCTYVVPTPKVIGFYQNFGHGDIGDDTALFVSQDLFKERIRPVSKRCYAFHPAQYKALLIGGRGAFHWACPYVPRRLLTKKQWPFPVVVYGAGINRDFDTEMTQGSKDAIRRLCDLSDYITVRDAMSRRFLASMGIQQVSILPDPEIIINEEQISLPVGCSAGKVGIALSPHSVFKQNTCDRIVEVFTQFINWLTDRRYEVVFFRFDQLGADSDREVKMIRKIMLCVRKPEAVIVFDGPLSPGQMVYAMKRLCRFFIGMRMHSVGFAANAGIPFLCIGFNDMHAAFLEMFSMDNELIRLDNLSCDLLVGQFLNMQTEEDLRRKKILLRRDELRSMIVAQSNIVTAKINAQHV